MTKVICKIRFKVHSSSSPIELVGQIESTQLFSDKSQWVTPKSNYYKDYQVYREEIIVPKGDILEISIYFKKKRYCINGEDGEHDFPINFYLNILGGEKSHV